MLNRDRQFDRGPGALQPGLDHAVYFLQFIRQFLALQEIIQLLAVRDLNY